MDKRGHTIARARCGEGLADEPMREGACSSIAERSQRDIEPVHRATDAVVDVVAYIAGACRSLSHLANLGTRGSSGLPRKLKLHPGSLRLAPEKRTAIVSSSQRRSLVPMPICA